MNNEIIQLARECGALHNTPTDSAGIEAFYREAQRRAFEKAAKVCEKSDRYRGDYFAAKCRELIGEQ